MQIILSVKYVHYCTYIHTVLYNKSRSHEPPQKDQIPMLPQQVAGFCHVCSTDAKRGRGGQQQFYEDVPVPYTADLYSGIAGGWDTAVDLQTCCFYNL